MPVLLDFIDPGNAGGSVRIPDAPRQVRLSFLCPYCRGKFDTEVAQVDHIHDEHPVRHPLLVIDGEPARPLHVIRRPLSASAFAPYECTHIFVSINGRAFKRVGATGLGRTLSRLRKAFAVVRLVSTTADTTYEIRVMVPSALELERAEEQFRQHLAKDDVTIEDVERFRESTLPCRSCSDFVGGLAEYVLGVLVKDQSGGATLPFEKHREQLETAMTCLSDYDQPISRALVNCIRLNLNEFDGEWSVSGVAPLDRAIGYFLARTRARESENIPGLGWRQGGGEAQRTNLCPIDETTALVLEGVNAATVGSTVSEELVRRLAHWCTLGRVSHADRVKMRVLLAELHGAKGERALADQYRSSLLHDHDFGPWARQNGAVR